MAMPEFKFYFFSPDPGSPINTIVDLLYGYEDCCPVFLGRTKVITTLTYIVYLIRGAPPIFCFMIMDDLTHPPGLIPKGFNPL